MQMSWVRDEIILAADLLQSTGPQPSVRDPRVIELSNLLRMAKFHPVDRRDGNFRSPASIRRKMADITTSSPDYMGRPTKGNSLDPGVRADFEREPEAMHSMALLIRSLIAEGIEPIPSGDLDQFETAEGGLVTVVVRRRERDRGLRERKIRRARSEGRRLDCEVCGINFEEVYGPRGKGYIEVHHILPLHVSGSVATSLDDLALLCGNCHRMVHRAPWTTPDRLKADCARVAAHPSSSSGYRSR